MHEDSFHLPPSKIIYLSILSWHLNGKFFLDYLITPSCRSKPLKINPYLFSIWACFDRRSRPRAYHKFTWFEQKIENDEGEREKERQREVVSRVINRSRINSTIIKRRSLESPVQRKAEDERRGEKLREKGGGFCVLKRQLGSEP